MRLPAHYFNVETKWLHNLYDFCVTMANLSTYETLYLSRILLLYRTRFTYFFNTETDPRPYKSTRSSAVRFYWTRLAYSFSFISFTPVRTSVFVYIARQVHVFLYVHDSQVTLCRNMFRSRWRLRAELFSQGLYCTHNHAYLTTARTTK